MLEKDSTSRDGSRLVNSDLETSVSMPSLMQLFPVL